MTSNLKKFKKMVRAALSDEIPTRKIIREEIQLVRKLFDEISDEQAERVAREFEAIHCVTMQIGAKLEEKGFEKWLDDARKNIDFYFWNRYRQYLSEEQDYSGPVLATIDNVTNRTLGLLENPDKEGHWNRRGMVVGHIQSGKTANYTGLICKAADAGYKVIIVIAGIHNNLRAQTQIRLDMGFVGYDSTNLLSNKKGVNRVIGVGLKDQTIKPNQFTNSIRDFNKATANSLGIPLENLKHPALFVIKKNTNTLQNLFRWMKTQSRNSTIEEPMLLIDDEADNASINIRMNQEKISRLNGLIRQLLNVFDRSCYVGYTATPFANIFIDPDSEDEMFGNDLFPRDFIVSLDPPSNYFGASRIFYTDPEETEKNVTVRYIEDNSEILPIRHKIDHRVVEIPESLRNAVRAFIIARAIRLVRGHEGEHNSMLVNASRFNSVQSQLRNELHEFVRTLSDCIYCKIPRSETFKTGEFAKLHDVFIEEFANSCNATWTDVSSRLWESVSSIQVIEVNHRATGSLDYSASGNSGLNVIAVGGYSLSRGLTLEGLTISYFLRNSIMYDTLMQMGRWFGYRDEYEDLCRIWMTREAEGWYTHISESIEELREEFKRMEAANATPKQFGLKVRNHPDTLIVTARNKMGSGQKLVVKVGLSNKFVETAVLKRDTQSLNKNREAAISLAQIMRLEGFAPEKGTIINGSYFVENVPVEPVIEFLSVFTNHPASFLTESDPILDYIQSGINAELARWEVLFAGIKKPSERSLRDESLGIELICQRRIAGKRSDTGKLYITDKQRVSSRGVERFGLSREEQESAEESYRNNPTTPQTGSNVNYPDRIYRRIRKRPLLVIHLLAIGGKDADLSDKEPVVAWSISFPDTEREEHRVEYVVNATLFHERYGYEDEGEEDEAVGDDE